MSSVFVSHPGLQHSHQLATALHERGMLQAFWSGVPVKSEGGTLPFWLPNRYASKVKSVAIPSVLRRHPMAIQALLRVGSLLPGSFSREDFAHRIFHLYDWWVSRHIQQLNPRVVVAFENSAYHTFGAAKKIGALCILDAPSLHHGAQANLMLHKKTKYLDEINRRKDAEISRADFILTCSPLAESSYVEYGVKPKNVVSILLGATLPYEISRWEKHSLPLHFIFVGALRRLKSIDLILQTFARLNDEGIGYRLSFVGGEGESGWVEAIAKVPNASYLGSLPQNVMYQQLAQADCLLLPSRYDSFGMVVAEAFACGTPAIVSTQTGAKAMIEQYPQSGWVIEPNVEAVYTCVKARILNRAELFDARIAALEAARDFTWSAYRARVGQFIEDRLKQ